MPKGSQRVIYTLHNKAKDKAKVIVKDKVKVKDMSILGKIFSSGAKELVESVDDSLLEDVDGSENLVLSSSMERYVSAVRKISPKK